MTLCDIGYVIKDHVPALMQLLTNELRDYGMQLLTTKCLNTAIMMWYLFLGEQQDEFGKASYCDSRSTQRRGREARQRAGNDEQEFRKHPLHPANVARRFGEELLSTVVGSAKDTSNTNTNTNTTTASCGRRTLFYVMLTDADMPCLVTEVVDERRNIVQQSVSRHRMRFFPGHVFVIEKVMQTPRRNRYNVYQSYINHYTLEGHAHQNRSFSMSQDGAALLVDDLIAMYESPTWSQRQVAFWKRFTHVDTSDCLGHQFNEQSYMCYRKANTTNCTRNLEAFLKVKLQELEVALDRDVVTADEPYGDTRLYTGRQRNVDIKVLSNAEMREEILAVLAKL